MTQVQGPVRFGVVGTGMMGCEHLRNLLALPDAIVAAYSDPNPTSREWAAMTLGEGSGAVAFADHRELAASGLVDAVVVASPNHTHAAVLDDLLATDLAVLVEKPLCTTLEDCRRMQRLAAERSALTWVGLEYRYMPPTQALVRELATGVAGRIHTVFVREHRFPFLVKVDDWNRFNRNTGGTLVEKCCHFFDLMRLLAGADPVAVMASGGQAVNHLDERYDGEQPDILDQAYVIVEFANGVRGCLDLCMFAEGGRNEQEIVVTGDAGKIEAFVPDGTLVVGERSAGRAVRTLDVSHDARIAYDGFHHGASYLELLEFCEALRTGAPAAVTVDDGLWSVAVGVAAHRSIDEERRVTLAELGL